MIRGSMMMLNIIPMVESHCNYGVGNNYRQLHARIKEQS